MVEVTIGRKNIKVRVTEVEGKLYNQCKMEKETNCTAETEEEEDSEDEEFFLTSDEESQARFSDEEVEEDDGQSYVQTMIPETVLKKQTCEKVGKVQGGKVGLSFTAGFRNSSVNGGKVGFYDKEDEQYELDEDDETIVQETVPEIAFNESPAHAEDKNDGHATVAELANAGDTPKTQKKTDENITDPALGLCACDSNPALCLCACVSNPVNILKASPVHAGDNMEGNVTIAVVPDVAFFFFWKRTRCS
ncbi:hypothetical protein L2E82_49761 [Cichorium intybus]|uniref:Uncharacterized protein n=1 Tax=Cichorium intybus TaxID=13427 RepID=A0ACB8Z096_CICIN|nr:hypothetical protein L2E82_49761 [Cichorium intybus]